MRLKIIQLTIICAVIFSGCSLKKGPYQETRVSLGTYVTIKVQDADKGTEEKRDAANKAFDEVRRIEGLLSSFKEGNIIDRINNSGTNEVFLDEETFYVLERSKYFYEASDGAFDITVLPLLEIWGFHEKKYMVPDEDKLKETLKRIGSDKMILDNKKKSVRFLEPGMKIDLGGIAAGYAVDRAVLVLKENGINNALVDAGGDIYCLGEKSKGKKWSVGIRDPRRNNRIIKTLYLKDIAVTTSGTYEKFFEKGGKRCSHIMDPRTGRPVDNELSSATIIAGDCLTADALATAAMVLGRDEAAELTNELVNVKVVSISKS